jgi:tRNA uridine 5-carboxymethylaminomethyl modification enzyme
MEKKRAIDECKAALERRKSGGKNYLALLKRKEMSIENLARGDEELLSFPQSVRKAVETEVRYSGYVARQNARIEQFNRMEGLLIPPGLDYSLVHCISSEAKEKLDKVRPVSLGQAARISGVKPADITNLLFYLRRAREGSGRGRE